MKFVVGIGNPGKQYEKTRHNIGFQVVDAILDNPKINVRAVKWTAEFRFKAFIAQPDNNLFLAKSMLFVNKTGDTVLEIQDQNPEMKPSDYLFVCDDVNLAYGKLRLRESGTAGGHHGLESVIEALGSEDFPRLRLGVKNENMPKDLTDFVLKPFSTGEKKEVNTILVNAASICETWMFEGFGAAINRLSRLQSDRGEKE